MKHYEINIGGYGGEVCWKEMTREQYDYWKNVDNDVLSKHVIGPSIFDDDDDDNDNNHPGNSINNIPEFALLKTDDDTSWYDLDDFAHENYCSLGNAWLSVVELGSGGDNTGEHGYNVVMSLDNLRRDASTRDLDMFVFDENPQRLEEGKQYLQVFSSEKGTFITAVVALDDNQEFELSKVKVKVCEALNEQDDMVVSVEYGGVELENEGSETRGKGIDIYLVDYLG